MRIHSVNLRVRYQETDQMGVVYYANYYVWFEVARTEYFRSLGFPYRNLEKDGIYLVAVNSSCQYKQPAHYDDQITVKSRISSIKNTSFIFEYEVERDKDILAVGKTVHVFINRKSKPVKIPAKVRELIERQI
ncbi:MAG: thioesterase family protein [Candidatus Omnitrophota bacterium]